MNYEISQGYENSKPEVSIYQDNEKGKSEVFSEAEAIEVQDNDAKEITKGNVICKIILWWVASVPMSLLTSYAITKFTL